VEDGEIVPLGVARSRAQAYQQADNSNFTVVKNGRIPSYEWSRALLF
jgi:hypothetical protein